MNNSVVRKTMEDIRNHKDMKLVKIQGKYTKYVMKRNLRDGYQMNKPVYLGKETELSKTLIYELHYDYMHPKHGSKVKLRYLGSFV